MRTENVLRGLMLMQLANAPELPPIRPRECADERKVEPVREAEEVPAE